MRLLEKLTVEHNGAARVIELYWGDLAWLPPQHVVDLLVLSAFPNDYLPTPTSLIGALARNGVSVARLALNKEADLRQEFSCWISLPLFVQANFRRILCIESGWRGQPPEIADDIFRALAPSSVSWLPNGTVAMPLIGAGDQGYSVGEMLVAILKAAVSWINRGLELRILKIVAYSDRDALKAQKAFLEFKRTLANEGARASTLVSDSGGRLGDTHGGPYDLFISYAHEDVKAAQLVYKSVTRLAPQSRIFFDRQSLKPGSSWLLEIADSLDTARLVTSLYTPNYWKSKYCKDEFCAAFIRQNDTGGNLIFPIFYQEVNVPYLFQTVQYIDCRECDSDKLNQACKSLCGVLSEDRNSPEVR